jgi:predicted metal-dependent hydrolase
MKRHLADELLERLNRDAQRVAAPFGLRYSSIEAERAGVKRRYGICYDDGRIRIRLFHAMTGRPLKYSSLVNTLCHELAHLRHMNHGERFRALYQRLLDYARLHGIYEPGSRLPVLQPDEPCGVPRPRQQAGPVQLALFG